jgi:hypothetical protein
MHNASQDKAALIVRNNMSIFLWPAELNDHNDFLLTKGVPLPYLLCVRVVYLNAIHFSTLISAKPRRIQHRSHDP